MDKELGKYILDKLDKMDDKIDDVRDMCIETKVKLEEHNVRTKILQDKIDTANVRLDEYNNQLEIHIRGVNLLDKRQTKLEEKVKPVIDKHNKSNIIKAWLKDNWKKATLIAGGISAISGAIVTLLKLYNVI